MGAKILFSLKIKKIDIYKKILQPLQKNLFIYMHNLFVTLNPVAPLNLDLLQVPRAT